MSRKPDPTDQYVGKRIRMRRLTLGLSQTDVAARLGLTFQQIQKYEKGTNRVGAGRLQTLSEILDVPVAFFFENLPDIRGQIPKSDRASSPVDVFDFAASRAGLALITAFVRIKDERVRNSVIELVRRIADSGQ